MELITRQSVTDDSRHGAWGMGHGAWGMGHEGDEPDEPDEGDEEVIFPMPNAYFPASY